MASSQQFLAQVKQGDIAGAIQSVLQEMTQLQIVTRVVNDGEAGSIEDLPDSQKICTQINILEGTIDTAVGSGFLSEGAYSTLASGHMHQVAAGCSSIRDNMDSLQTLLDLVEQAEWEEGTDVSETAGAGFAPESVQAAAVQATDDDAAASELPPPPPMPPMPPMPDPFAEEATSESEDGGMGLATGAAAGAAGLAAGAAAIAGLDLGSEEATDPLAELGNLDSATEDLGPDLGQDLDQDLGSDFGAELDSGIDNIGADLGGSETLGTDLDLGDAAELPADEGGLGDLGDLSLDQDSPVMEEALPDLAAADDPFAPDSSLSLDAAEESAMPDLADDSAAADLGMDLGSGDLGGDLGGDDLGGLDLGGGDLGSDDLGGLDLGGSDLGGSDDLGGDLGSDLGGDDLGGLDLGGGDLGGDESSSDALGGLDLGADLGGADLGGDLGSDLGGDDLGGSDLGDDALGGLDLGGDDASSADLGGDDLGGLDLGSDDFGAALEAPETPEPAPTPSNDDDLLEGLLSQPAPSKPAEAPDTEFLATDAGDSTDFLGEASLDGGLGLDAAPDLSNDLGDLGSDVSSPDLSGDPLAGMDLDADFPTDLATGDDAATADLGGLDNLSLDALSADNDAPTNLPSDDGLGDLNDDPMMNLSLDEPAEASNGSDNGSDFSLEELQIEDTPGDNGAQDPEMDALAMESIDDFDSSLWDEASAESSPAEPQQTQRVSRSLESLFAADESQDGAEDSGKKEEGADPLSALFSDTSLDDLEGLDSGTNNASTDNVEQNPFEIDSLENDPFADLMVEE